MAENKAKRTHKQRFKIFLNLLLIFILVVGIAFTVCAIVGKVGMKSNLDLISTLAPVRYEQRLEPVDDNGYKTFITDDDFKVLQLTDVHLGGGFMSIRKDEMAINAIASMISEERPDLVIVTGDIAYPVPFQAGTFNNKNGAKLFAALMEQLGVYWCPVYGNHDTEAYSFYDREDISEFYMQDEYAHCLFQIGDEDVDGYGNYVVNVKNTKNEITQSFFMIDSHAYNENGNILDKVGITWDYDCIHENQVEWYENEVKALTEINNGAVPKSLAFFHIPLIEFRDAWYEYRDNGFKDTENVKLYYGEAGETGEVIYSSEKNSGFFDKAQELGSTKGIFCGHDHLNNFSLDYKGIRLTYGYSIDYLAYQGIMNYGVQRGCTVIDVKPDGSFEPYLENYYQDKYKTVIEKEEVIMDDYNDGATDGQ